MRASYGTTKYCMAFLRGVTCADHSCMNLHEWGDEKDCFTKEDLTTLYVVIRCPGDCSTNALDRKHTMKDTETRRTTTIKKADEAEGKPRISTQRRPWNQPLRKGLPRAASWANKSTSTLSSTILHNAANQKTRRTGPTARQQRSGSTTTPVVSALAEVRKKNAVKASSSSSRPATPLSLPNRPVTPATSRTTKGKEPAAPPPPPPAARSPFSSAAVESDAGSAQQEVASPRPSPQVQKEVPAAPPGIPAVPPGLSPVVPPGLPAPPGLPPPSSRTTSEAASPQISMQPSQSSYQMSTQAQALMEDIRARRENIDTAVQSPFPDFDRMLQSLGSDTQFGGFSFNLDPKLAGDVQDDSIGLPDFDANASVPFNGGFFDVFPTLRPSGQAAANPLMPPPGIPFAQGRNIYDPLTGKGALERQSTGSSYTGSFNPFAGDGADETPSRKFSPMDEERKVSRFGFARGRQGSASSSLHASSPLSNAESISHLTHSHNAAGYSGPTTSQQWPFQVRHQEFASHYQSNSAMSSPLAQHMQAAQPPYNPPHQPPQLNRFQSYDNAVTEQQLREMIMSSRERTNVSRNGPMGRTPLYVYV